MRKTFRNVKKRPLYEDEEIESDYDDTEDRFSKKVHGDNSDVADLDELQKKREAAAARYLEEIGYGIKTEEEIAEKLDEEAAKASKKISYQIADKVSFGEPVFYKAHKDGVTSVVICENTRNIAYTASKDCKIIKWNIETGQKSQFSGGYNNIDCGGHFKKCLDLCLDADGNVLYSAGDDKTIRIWDVRNSLLKPVAILLGHTNSITGLRLDPDKESNTLYSTGPDKSLRHWDLVMRRCQDVFYGHTAQPNCLDILTPGNPVSGGDDATVRYWKLASRTHLLFENKSTSVDCVYQLNYNTVLSGSQDGILTMWKLGSRVPSHRMEKVHGNSWITALGGIRYSDLFFSGSDDGFIRCWKMSFDKSGKKLKSVFNEITDMKIPVTGVITSISTTLEKASVIVAGVSREHRLGRWKNLKEARNGLCIIPLTASESIYDDVTY